jgi:murein DD-endopeptidase MepM/ murein hydrolase activator NlpD
MRGDDDLLWLLLGGAAVIMTQGESIEWGDGWHWPVPDLLTQAGRFPAIATQEFSAAHRGLDIMLSRTGVSPTGEPVIISGFEPGQRAADGVTMDATKSGRFFAPLGLWVLAARPGKIWAVAPTVNGTFVDIDHGKPWATRYGHLDTVRVKVGDTVVAGEIIGTVGAGLNIDPSKGQVDAQHLRHLHFEAWYKGDGSHAVDPQPEINTWKRSTWQL